MDRKMEFLHRKKIIYRRFPITDEPDEITDDYYFYKDGTHQCYELFRSKAKITSYKSLKWHLLVIWYLNPNMSLEEFKTVSLFISDGKNGFVSFRPQENIVYDIIDDIYRTDLEYPPSNKQRKIIFKDSCTLDVTEKLKIVGRVIGRSAKISESDIYESMLYLHDKNELITNKKIAEILNVSERTVMRTITEELNTEKKLMNQEIKSNKV
jgi:hypothetical protein